MRTQNVNIAVGIILTTLLCIGCGGNKHKNLEAKWKSAFLQNTKMDADISAMRAYIDTVGNQDVALRKQLNVDSLKNMLRAELENAMTEQRISLENTTMEFLPNGMVYTTSVSGVDSAMYEVEENMIVIDESKLKGYGETLKLEILKLTKDTLQVKMVDYGDTSMVVMVPVKD